MGGLGVGLALLVAFALLVAIRLGGARLLPEGTEAPAFALPNQDGRTVGSRELRGSWWVLYFYPKDQTPGCTREACTFQDRLDDLAALGVRVVGVSRDGVAAHRAFADRHGLAFDLLADAEGEVVRAYRAGSAVPGLARRVSYLVDPTGRIRRTYPRVSPARHAARIITDVKALRGA